MQQFPRIEREEATYRTFTVGEKQKIWTEFLEYCPCSVENEPMRTEYLFKVFCYTRGKKSS